MSMINNFRRLYVEKKPAFRVEADNLLSELNENLGAGLKSLRLINVYDLGGFSDALLEKTRNTVFSEPVTDDVYDDFDLSAAPYIGIEALPGQFDQRASSAVECVRLAEPSADVRIKYTKLIVFDGGITPEALKAVEKYCINAVECRKKDFSVKSFDINAEVAPMKEYPGFLQMEGEALTAFCRENGLAMNEADLAEVVKYFRQEGREPSETELKILDTYWSDHCRHTTFNTRLGSIEVEDSFIREDIEASIKLYDAMRQELGRASKPVSLMDMATIGARWLKSKGLLDDQEVSEENNACSIHVTVDVDGRDEDWLLMFKNETHNHPTEIEPFGGAATCLGGAIRDPLSGRSYVYQAMRITGAGDIWKPVSETLEGKLPQKIISRKAAHGYSSYGNQIGLATTFVKEIIHPGYTAKRLEIGAVAGAVKASNVRRESPAPGDVVLLAGGRTGRDGIGGATGSSKRHTGHSIETCGSEVQKGNPPEERKLQRLFRRPDVTCLIKKSNDFGAGGVSVAVGELADGLDIWLDRVPVKYTGLNPTELAISESQERMAVVIAPRDKDAFMEKCAEENVEVTEIAKVTDTGRMVMHYGGKVVADLRRDFIDSAGAAREADAVIRQVTDKDPFAPLEAEGSLSDRLSAVLARPDVASQKGLVEMFDSTIGRSTVLMPYGGMTYETEAQVSVQKLPADGFTDTASMMSYGFDPELSSWSPYHGAAYAVVDAVSKAVAAGADWSRMRFSYQEYFEKMTSDPRTWGLPASALLGALKMQHALGLPSIGGKDSMSGSFEDLNVPPTLVAFGVVPVKASGVISPEFKWEGNSLYLVRHTPLGNHMPDTDMLKANWDNIRKAIGSGLIVSAFALHAGVGEALAKMSFGNALGVDVNLSEKDLFGSVPGSILVETTGPLDIPNAEYLGSVTDGNDGRLHINGSSLSQDRLLESYKATYSSIYPIASKPAGKKVLPAGINAPVKVRPPKTAYEGTAGDRPLVFIPVFPGTNCDYDTAKAFRREGADVRFEVFRNLTPDDIVASEKRFAGAIDSCQILALCGGFSAGDEPDGSGKFIADVLSSADVSAAIERLIARKGLILGICNGFQALVKCGLLPYGRFGAVSEASPTLFRNDINRHVSQMVTTKVTTVASPWLKGLSIGDEFTVPVSHGEGKFVVSEELARELFENGQVAFRYADAISSEVTMTSPSNPNGSSFAIEGIISRDGLILGKMGHSERYEDGLFKNITGDFDIPLFRNAVSYFKKASE